ncbi:uncharacterized protein [Oscarella lobularis]|uniref:uncharacterized protein n=1 Tax=Oscarella lobularis TaxID=121494 RepID=UPI0033144928
MARATPREIRWKVIILWKLFNYSVPQTCQALGLTRASVYNFRKLYTDTGRVDVDVVRRGRMPKLTDPEAAALVQHMKINPSHHSSDFQAWFERKFGKKLSKSTIGRYFHMNGYRKGKNRKEWVQVDISRKESKTTAFDDVPKLDFKSCFDTFLQSEMGDTIQVSAAAAAAASSTPPPPPPATAAAAVDSPDRQSDSMAETLTLSPEFNDDDDDDDEIVDEPESPESRCNESVLIQLPAALETTGEALRSLREHNPLASWSLPKQDDQGIDFVKYFDQFVASFESKPSQSLSPGLPPPPPPPPPPTPPTPPPQPSYAPHHQLMRQMTKPFQLTNEYNPSRRF